MKVHLKALGCRLNEAELESWATEFLQAGHTLVNEVQLADLTVLNTCAVTQEAVRKSRKLINRVRRENPSGRMVVSGCFVSTGESGDAKSLGVDMLVDNQHKGELVKQVSDRWQIPIMPEGATLPNESSLFARNRQRAFIKIQDGCRYRCSYCVVTIARGQEKSRPITDIINQINSLHLAGIQEVVLTGVHVGGYGSDIASDLPTLVAEILKHTSVPRLRFASVEPWDLGEGFFSLFENSRLMPHMHLPVQSGSDSVLRRMSRRCHTSDFAALVKQARRQHDGFNVTTDIIVGFPGETDSEWQQTIDFVNDIEFGHIHVFSYSTRAGTKAASMPEQIDDAIKRHRSRELHDLAATQKKSFLTTQLGTHAEVLWEGTGTTQQDRVYGYTENYTRVVARGKYSSGLSNTIGRCLLSRVGDSGQHVVALPEGCERQVSA